MNATITNIFSDPNDFTKLQITIDITDSNNNPVETKVLAIPADTADSNAIDTAINDYINSLISATSISDSFTDLVGKQYSTVSISPSPLPVGTISKV